jgi:YD repeat-containing protein
VSYGYDDSHQLTSITQGTSVVGFTYDDAGRRATLTYPNGIVAAYGYDAANRPIGDGTVQPGRLWRVRHGRRQLERSQTLTDDWRRSNLMRATDEDCR